MMRNCSGAPRASAEGKEEDAAFASGLQGRGGGLCLGTAAERRHPCKMLPTGACHLLGGQVLCKVAEPFKRPDGCDLFPSRCDAATFQLTSRRLSLLETPHLKGHPEHRQTRSRGKAARVAGRVHASIYIGNRDFQRAESWQDGVEVVVIWPMWNRTYLPGLIHH
ncbi:uncharacterized protein [Narcine bancroftii]|uniref:uncharacterized protein isoform X5 n=1 Tax=Narcine bancroftii TaxID=1343680 RepID=UPI0038310034